MHTFARNERWKEELLLVKEEMRRLGQTHLFLRQKAANDALEAERIANEAKHPDLFSFGFASLLKKRLLKIENEIESLPIMVKNITGIGKS